MPAAASHRYGRHKMAVRAHTIEVPRCPRPAHGTSAVVRGGTYGVSGHRRQLFLCRPHRGSPHRFAGTLPRELTTEPLCVECLTVLHPHEGPPYPQAYQFPARQVAAALVAVGKGDAYHKAAEDARTNATRVRRNRRTASKKRARFYGANGTPTGDWVEVFAPILWQPHAPTAWPEIVAFDDLPFAGIAKSKRTAASKPIWPALPSRVTSGRGGRPLFAVLGAYGYKANGLPDHLWLLRAVPTPSTANITAYLLSLPGIPRVVICDPSWAWNKAIREAWPAPNTPEIVWSEYHLKETLTRILNRAGIGADHRLRKALAVAFWDAASWAAFDAESRRWGIRELDDWLDRRGPRVGAQIVNHTTRQVRRTTGGIEKALKVVKSRLYDRRALFSNRERTDRLLMLMTLDHRGLADERRYAKEIREWLTARGGRPDSNQGAIADTRRTSSLRAKAR
jgi:hypothetical protein